jgi:DNA-binding IclR family transcriptional regulator
LVSSSADNYQVRAVSRALKILTSFTVENPYSNLMNYPKCWDSQEHIITSPELSCQRGFVNKVSDGYSLGTKAFEIGSTFYLTHMPFARAARAHMVRLVDKWQLSANLAVLDKAEVLYVDVLEPNQPLRVKFSIGSRLGIHCTALGKVLVSEIPSADVRKILAAKGMRRYTPNTIVDPDKFIELLAEVHEKGYAVDNEEVIVGVRCIAAPIRDSSGMIVNALSLSGPTSYLTVDKVPELAASLVKSAGEISAMSLRRVNLLMPYMMPLRKSQSFRSGIARRYPRCHTWPRELRA